jgi:hypothetical protein
VAECLDPSILDDVILVGRIGDEAARQAANPRRLGQYVLDPPFVVGVGHLL